MTANGKKSQNKLQTKRATTKKKKKKKQEKPDKTAYIKNVEKNEKCHNKKFKRNETQTQENAS